MFLVIRSALFQVYFYSWTSLCCVAMMPFFVLPTRLSYIPGFVWSAGVITGLKWICGINYVLRGKENLPKKTGFVLASKHQSAWDTIIFLLLFKHSCYVLKQELLKLPLFGHYLKVMQMIAVNRSGGASALKNMVVQVKDRVDKKRVVVIFPEGTRTKPYEQVKYHPGIALINQANDEKITVPIIPVALNSGLFWGRGQFVRPSGTVIVEFMPAMPVGLEKKSFMDQLHDHIEQRTKLLLDEHKKS